MSGTAKHKSPTQKKEDKYNTIRDDLKTLREKYKDYDKLNKNIQQQERDRDIAKLRGILKNQKTDQTLLLYSSHKKDSEVIETLLNNMLHAETLYTADKYNFKNQPKQLDYLKDLLNFGADAGNLNQLEDRERFYEKVLIYYKLKTPKQETLKGKEKEYFDFIKKNYKAIFGKYRETQVAESEWKSVSQATLERLLRENEEYKSLIRREKHINFKTANAKEVNDFKNDLAKFEDFVDSKDFDLMTSAHAEFYFAQKGKVREGILLKQFANRLGHLKNEIAESERLRGLYQTNEADPSDVSTMETLLGQIVGDEVLRYKPIRNDMKLDDQNKELFRRRDKIKAFKEKLNKYGRRLNGMGKFTAKNELNNYYRKQVEKLDKIEIANKASIKEIGSLIFDYNERVFEATDNKLDYSLRVGFSYDGKEYKQLKYNKTTNQKVEVITKGLERIGASSELLGRGGWLDKVIVKQSATIADFNDYIKGFRNYHILELEQLRARFVERKKGQITMSMAEQRKELFFLRQMVAVYNHYPPQNIRPKYSREFFANVKKHYKEYNEYIFLLNLSIKRGGDMKMEVLGQSKKKPTKTDDEEIEEDEDQAYPFIYRFLYNLSSYAEVGFGVSGAMYNLITKGKNMKYASLFRSLYPIIINNDKSAGEILREINIVRASERILGDLVERIHTSEVDINTFLSKHNDLLEKLYSYDDNKQGVLFNEGFKLARTNSGDKFNKAMYYKSLLVSYKSLTGIDYVGSDAIRRDYLQTRQYLDATKIGETYAELDRLNQGKEVFVNNFNSAGTTAVFAEYARLKELINSRSIYDRIGSDIPLVVKNQIEFIETELGELLALAGGQLRNADNRIGDFVRLQNENPRVNLNIERGFSSFFVVFRQAFGKATLLADGYFAGKIVYKSLKVPFDAIKNVYDAGIPFKFLNYYYEPPKNDTEMFSSEVAKKIVDLDEDKSSREDYIENRLFNNNIKEPERKIITTQKVVLKNNLKPEPRPSYGDFFKDNPSRRPMVFEPRTIVRTIKTDDDKGRKMGFNTAGADGGFAFTRGEKDLDNYKFLMTDDDIQRLADKAFLIKRGSLKDKANRLNQTIPCVRCGDKERKWSDFTKIS